MSEGEVRHPESRWKAIYDRFRKLWRRSRWVRNLLAWIVAVTLFIWKAIELILDGMMLAG